MHMRIIRALYGELGPRRLLTVEPTVVPPTDGGGGDPKPPGETPPPTTDTWITRYVPEALRGEKTWTKFKGKDDAEHLSQALTSYHNLEKHMGTAVVVPKEGAPKEEWDAYYEKLGRPKTDAEYGEVAIPEALKPKWDSAAVAEARKQFHALGLTGAQFKGVMEQYVKHVSNQTDTDESKVVADLKASETVLRTKWGGAYGRNVALANRAFSDLGTPELRQLLDTDVPGVGRVGNHPAFMDLGVRMGQIMLEGDLIPANAVGGGTVADAEAEISKIMNDREHAYWHKDKPGHKEAVQHVAGLHNIVYAGQ